MVGRRVPRDGEPSMIFMLLVGFLLEYKGDNHTSNLTSVSLSLY